MTILTREGIDGIANHHRYDVDLGRWDADELDLIDTARAYHDLRDAVLAWCDERDEESLSDPYDVVVTAHDVREVVARVERGE